MSDSRFLFDLIKSLSKTEKAYFKKFGYKRGKGKEDPYLQLFDELEKQRDFDEAALKKKFAKGKYFSRYSAAKHHLYNTLLNCLLDYHKGKSESDKMQIQIREIRLLKEKGLDRQWGKKLKSLKKRAYELEEFLYLEEILELEAALIPYKESNYKERIGLFDEMGKIQNLRKNQTNYLKLYDEIIFFTQKHGWTIRKEAQLSRLKTLLKHPLLSRIDSAMSFDAKFNFYRCLSAIYILLGDFDLAYKYTYDRVRLFMDFPDFKAQKSDLYLQELGNLLSRMLNAGRWEKFEEIEAEFHEVLSKTEESKRTRIAEVRLLNTRLAMNVKTGNFKEALEMIPEVESRIDVFDLNKGFIAALHFDFACIYFYNGKYSLSLDHINTVLNEPELKVNTDFLGFVHILNLLTHYELENTEHLESIQRATLRFLNNKKRLFKLEEYILRFIKNMPDFRHKKEEMEALGQLQTELKPLLDDPYEKNAFLYFDFMIWLESKLTGKSILELGQK